MGWFLSLRRVWWLREGRVSTEEAGRVPSGETNRWVILGCFFEGKPIFEYPQSPNY